MNHADNAARLLSIIDQTDPANVRRALQLTLEALPEVPHTHSPARLVDEVLLAVTSALDEPTPAKVPQAA